MEAKPGSSSEGPAPEPGAGETPAERYGPLDVRRLLKDDGRDLIVYERARPADGGDGSETAPAP